MIKTERLIIRKPKMRDLNDIYEFSKSEDVGPNAGWLAHKTIKDTKKILRYNIKQGDVYVIYYKLDKKVVGLISFMKMSILKNEYELGYVLSKDYWNLKIMSESVNIFLNYMINNYNIEKIVTGHAKDNIASKKIILNNGFKFKYIDNNPQYENKNIKEVYMYELNIKKEHENEKRIIK